MAWGREWPDRRPEELQPALTQRQLFSWQILSVQRCPFPAAQKHLVPITVPSSRDEETPQIHTFPFLKLDSALLVNSISFLCTDLYYRGFVSLYSVVFFYKALDFQAFDLASQDILKWLAKKELKGCDLHHPSLHCVKNDQGYFPLSTDLEESEQPNTYTLDCYMWRTRYSKLLSSYQLPMATMLVAALQTLLKDNHPVQIDACTGFH